MSERLLGPSEIARRLSISRTHLYRILPGLLSQGLQRVIVGGRAKYCEASLDLIIRGSADRERPLVSAHLAKQFDGTGNG
jgi:sugar-specific transcriptional regulator TrmB